VFERNRVVFQLTERTLIAGATAKVMAFPNSGVEFLQSSAWGGFCGESLLYWEERIVPRPNEAAVVNE
jgi:hypothetical protein